MADRRKKNCDWNIYANDSGDFSYEAAHLAVLMDIRDELQTLNAVFRCSNFLAIPRILRRISANTAKPRKPKNA